MFVASLSGAVVTACFAPAALRAQTSSDETIIITASRTNADQALGTTTISKDQINRLQPYTLLDPLNDVAGVRGVSTGGRAGESFLSIRGGEPNYTLVLIDGVRVNDITDSAGGAFDFGLIDPKLVERVDVSKGAGSGVQGSAALSGIVSIHLREPPSQLALGATGQIGTEGLGSISASAGDGWSGGSALLWGGVFSSGQQDGEYLNRQSGLFRGMVVLGSYDLAILSLIAGSQRRSFPEDSGGPALAVNRMLGTGQKTLWLTAFTLHRSTGSLRPNVEASYSVQQSTSQTPAIALGVLSAVPALTDNSRIERARISAFFAVDSGVARATWGAEVLDERGKSDGSIAFKFLLPTHFAIDRTTVSGFGELTLTPLSQLTINLAGRYDRTSDKYRAATGRIAIEYRFDGFALFGHVGNAFKLPSFYALGQPLVGNPSLEPERNRDAEIGTSVPLAPAVSFRAALFDNQFSNLIDFDAASFRLVNRSFVHARGAEISATAAKGAVTASGAVSYVSIESDATLRKRPSWSGNVRMAWTASSQLELNGGVRFNSSFFDSSVPTGEINVPGHIEFDVGVRARLAKGLTIDGTVRNISNAAAREAVGYNGLGRVARLTVSWSQF